MYRFFKKFHLERYFSSKLILAIDLFVSVVASMFSLFLIQALLHPITTGLVSFTIKWLLCSAIATLAAIVVFKTHYGIIRHSTLREIGRLGMAVLLKDALML
ncbi:MAG: polysaccharide biosynthesis protein, partial [Bacteroidales bacterium]|nr:polysaccharide biosynthesis protein [Bacteroidales bacterium]